MDSVKIVTWNARSIGNKLGNLKLLIYAEKPHVVLIQETWHTDNKNDPSFINYQCYWNNRESEGGGTAILIRSDVVAVEKLLNKYMGGKLEIQCVRIKTSRGWMSILNIYNPNQIIDTNEYTHYFEQMGTIKIVAGDFNSHNKWWGGPEDENNKAGKQLEDAILGEDLALLTPKGMKTYTDPRTGKQCTLDLIFVSPNIKGISSIKLEDDLGSDHNAIVLKIQVKPQIEQVKVRRRWKLEKGDWLAWKREVKKNMVNNVKQNLEEQDEWIASSIYTASEKCIPRTSEVWKPKYSKPWWSEECKRLLEIKKEKKKIFIKNPILYNKIQFRKAENQFKKQAKKAKKESWISYCNNLTNSTPAKQVWQQINRIKGTRYHNEKPFLVDGKIIIDKKEKVEVFKKQFEEKLNNNMFSFYKECKLLVIVRKNIEIENNENYNSLFTYTELINIQQKMNKSAPGFDNIHNVFLKNLPETCRNKFLEHFNMSWEQGKVPIKWKKSIIYPILKKDKPETDPNSYRPISLLSGIGKWMEGMVRNRLEYILESKDALSNSQFGYRKKHSTYDMLFRIENAARIAIAKQEYMQILFIDLSQAYDNVQHAAVLHKLAKLGIKGRMMKWIQNYLEDREFKVFYKGEYSSWKVTTTGVPQGAILSPLLFNVLLSDLPQSKNVFYGEYADDIVMYTSNRDFNKTIEQLQQAVDAFTKWCKMWGQEINIKKTKYMCITNKKGKEGIIRIAGNQIEKVQVYKYLGVYLDAPRLNFNYHIEQLKESVIKKMNILKAVATENWGADRHTLTRIYKMIVRSKMDYGDILYSVNKTNIMKLNKIQNVALRKILGAKKTSPIESMEIESNILPLYLHREHNMVKYYLRVMQLEENNILSKEIDQIRDMVTSISWKKRISPPFIVRIKQCLQKWNICEEPYAKVKNVGPVAPWNEIKPYIEASFPMTKTSIDQGNLCEMFYDLQETNYQGYIEIFTDGSKMEDGRTASGMYVPTCRIKKAWRLSSKASVLTAEIYALHKAVEWTEREEESVVIYSDSQAALSLIKNRDPKSNINLVYKIQEIINKANPGSIRLQYVPAHIGIYGNETVDSIAKAGCQKQYIEYNKISKEDMEIYVRSQLKNQWRDHWEHNCIRAGKGWHLKDIIGDIPKKPRSVMSSRKVDTIITRMRIGHIELNSYLKRFKVKESGKCKCGVEETVEHFILKCVDFKEPRKRMCQRLKAEANMTHITVKSILGEEADNRSTCRKIYEAIAEYILATGRFSQ